MGSAGKGREHEVNKTKSLTIGIAVMACAAFSGCVMLLPGQTATDAEMAADVMPTYAQLSPDPTIEPLPRESLLGEWEATVSSNSKCVIRRFRRVFDSPPATGKQSYKFFKDGKYVFAATAQDGNETVSDGEWTYANGLLTISEKKEGAQGHSIGMKVLWSAPDKMELRVDDLSAYENVFRESPGLKSISARLEHDGSLRTTMEIENNGTASEIKMIQSPLRFTRKGDAE